MGFPRRAGIALSLLSTWMCFGTPRASAADLIWNPGGATPPNGGAGNWDTDVDHKFWFDGSAAVAWTNVTPGNNATFPTMTPATANVQLLEDETAGNVRFIGNGYTLVGGVGRVLALNANGGSRITVDDAATATISVNIGGNQISKDGKGALVLNGTNSFTGGMTVFAGTLQTANSGLGAGRVRMLPSIASPATLVLRGGTLTNDFAVDAGAQDTSTVRFTSDQGMSGTLALGADVTMFADAAVNADLTGRIAGNGGIIKDGPGTLAIVPPNGAQSSFYSGGTRVKKGELYIERESGLTVLGSGSVNVDSGATLHSATARIESSLQVANGGTLKLSTRDSTEPGELEVGSAAIGGAKFSLLATGDSDNAEMLDANSLLKSNGNINITDATLSLQLLLYTPRVDDKLFIIDLVNNTSTRTGMFAGLGEGGILTVRRQGTDYLFKIFYNADVQTGATTGGNDVLLVVVPEPSTIAMFTVVSLGASLRRRRRTAHG